MTDQSIALGHQRVQKRAYAHQSAGADLLLILVTGQQPGPGLWKVTHPSAGHDHVLWILGSYGPLPRKMQWRSKNRIMKS